MNIISYRMTRRGKERVCIEEMASSSLCAFKDYLGIPKEGIHRLRIPGTDAAAADVLMSLALVWALSAFSKIPMTLCFILVFTLAFVLHLVFCVQTSATYVFL